LLQRGLFLAAVATLALLCAGCAAVLVGGAAAGGAGAVAYVRGELKATLDAALPQACQAVDGAAAHLQLRSESATEDGLESKRLFRTAQDRRVTVRLERTGDRATAIGIRVGTFGDQSLSQQLLNEIQRRL